MLVFNLAYRLLNNGRRSVPAALYNVAAQLAPHLKQVGCDAVEHFPFTKSASGASDNADGYGQYDDYDLGSKNQFYSIGTRFGTVDELLRCVACSNACGLDTCADLVVHQYYGGNRGNYTYFGADRKAKNGRFPKFPSCFVGPAPEVPADSVFDPEGNYPFGDMISYQHSTPKGYMLAGKVAAQAWQQRRVGFRLARLDDTKGESIYTSDQMIKALRKLGVAVYGECFTGNTDQLLYWDAQIRGMAGTLDFPLHWALTRACNGYDANAMRGEGLCLRNPGIAWKFRDTADTDTSPGQQIISNGLLANLRILTSPGENVLLYAKDYLPDTAGGYGLAKWMENQIWIAKSLGFGEEVQRYSNDRSVAVFERLGYPGLITAYNFDTYNSRKVTVQTNMGPGTQLWDYAGHHETIWTDGDGRATFLIPPNHNSNGQSYVCFSRTGYTQGFALQKETTTQTFEASEDLDIGPAQPNGTHTANLWCEAGTPIELSKSKGDGVRFIVTDSAGNEVIPRGKWEGKTKMRGWHHVVAYAPGAENTDYVVAANYMGTQGLTDDDLAQPAPGWLPAYVAPPAKLILEKS